MNTLSERFFQRGSEFLGVRYPIMCGAMTWVSDPKLVAAICNTGGFGCLAGGNTPIDILREQIEETRRLTDKPFAVNLVTIAPAYPGQLDMLCEMKVPVIIFAGSFPRGSAVEQAKSSGSEVLAFASTLSIARRMLGYGVDGLILEGMEAGGHVGHVSLTVLLQQVLFEVQDVPIFAAGGIATGKMCAHLLLMGAAGVQLGTRFAMAKESCAHANFKQAFIKAHARDAISTPQFDSRLPVVAVRALRNRGLDDFNRLQLDLIAKLDRGEIPRAAAQEEVEKFWMGALRCAVQDGDVDRGSLMAGQSVGLIDREETIAEIFDDLLGGIESELGHVRESLA
jgi:enoyl-[acyl-carrier protein] reductase II